jgi:hypothetical protein
MRTMVFILTRTSDSIMRNGDQEKYLSNYPITVTGPNSAADGGLLQTPGLPYLKKCVVYRLFVFNEQFNKASYLFRR